MEEFKIKTVQHILKLLIVVSTIFCETKYLQAQQNTDASGGKGYGTGGSSSYSVGQIDYTVATGSGGKITQGLQQPYEILILSGIEETDIILSLSAYPNPTSDFVILNIKNLNIQNMSYIVFDGNGKLIEKQKINSSQTLIDMANLANAVYFLKVLNKGIELKTFKIIKNK